MTEMVTVLIRTYNSQSTIERALRSVLDQTLRSEEYSILVIDDGSTDESVEIVKRYSDVVILQLSHVGSIPALNSGIESVNTPFVIILDSDDWFEPTILESMTSVFKEKEDTDFVYCDYYEVIGESRKVVSVGENIFNTVAAGIMFSTDLLRSYGMYDEALIFPEYDLLIRMLPGTIQHHISTPLYNYCRHKDSLTADESLIRQGKEQLFEKYKQHFPIRDY